MTRRELTDSELETLFRAGRSTGDVADPGFLDRMALEAMAAVPPLRAEVRVPIWQRLHDLLGGWRGLGGLALAGCAGLWIGVSPPSGMPDPVEYLISDALSESYDLVLLADADLWDEEDLGDE